MPYLPGRKRDSSMLNKDSAEVLLRKLALLRGRSTTKDILACYKEYFSIQALFLRSKASMSTNTGRATGTKERHSLSTSLYHSTKLQKLPLCILCARALFHESSMYLGH